MKVYIENGEKVVQLTDGDDYPEIYDMQGFSEMALIPIPTRKTKIEEEDDFLIAE